MKIIEIDPEPVEKLIQITLTKDEVRLIRFAVDYYVDTARSTAATPALKRFSSKLTLLQSSSIKDYERLFND